MGSGLKIPSSVPYYVGSGLEWSSASQTVAVLDEGDYRSARVKCR